MTPPHMFAPMAGNPQGGRGEAGEYLEYLIFGGRIITLCNPDDSMDLVCPYLPALMEDVSHKLIHFLGRYQLPC